MMNPAKLLKMKSIWDRFKKNHPKFPNFLQAVKQYGLQEGNVIEISVRTNDGKVIASNIKLTASDMELIQEIKKQTV